MHGPSARRWLAGVALALATPAHAGSLGFQWNPSPGAAGYRLRFGTDPAHLDRQMVVHGVTRLVVPGLTDCTRWYATVAAFNAAGESAPSPAVASWPRPTVTRLVPSRVMQGDEIAVTLVGNNFAPGSAVEMASYGVDLEVVGQNCGELDLDVTAAPAAPGQRAAESGLFGIQVLTPEGLAVAGTLEIVVDPSRFDINRTAPPTDGKIDGGDAVWIGRRFGGRVGDAVYDPDYDFTGDGWIDGDEMALLGSTLGRCWSGTAWTYAACPESQP